VRFEARESLILRAAPVHESFLRAQFPHAFRRETTLAFNPETRAVEAFEQQRYGAIVLARSAIGAPRDARSAAMLLEGIAALGMDAMPWTEALRQWQMRVACLAEWCPELGLPRCDDEALAATLADWLGPYLEGKARLSELDAGTLGEALSSRLDHKQRRALDELAPVALAVPSGNSRRLEYRAGQGPLLSVKLQELFGLADTPRIARGRVPVTLALLSPAQRPIQLTQDLRGFWERTYPEVRKELKGRYPRHPWPDDPWSAQPTARAKRRG
jgi:ATP-dependent helicase HrpB